MTKPFFIYIHLYALDALLTWVALLCMLYGHKQITAYASKSTGST
jgi:hypothetical protein